MRSICAFLLPALVVACTSLHPPTHSGSPVATDQTPTDRYEAYRVALDRAKTIDEVLPLTSEAVREQMAKSPPEYRKALLGDMQQRTCDDLRVLEENVSGDVASLTVEGVCIVDPMRSARVFGHGKVILLREKGAWRVDDEVWTLEGEDTSGLTPRDWKKASTTKKW